LLARLTIGSSDRGESIFGEPRGVDDLDKSALLDVGAIPRRSTSSLAAMVNELRLFRSMVVIAAILTVFSPIIDLASPSLTFAIGPGSHSDRPEGWNAALAVASWGSLVSIGVGIVAAVGLLFLRRWARPMACFAAVASAIVYLPVGEVSRSGIGFSFTLFAMGVWSGAIVMAYFGQPSARFLP
jgi:hypothetical protein